MVRYGEFLQDPRDHEDIQFHSQNHGTGTGVDSLICMYGRCDFLFSFFYL